MIHESAALIPSSAPSHRAQPRLLPDGVKRLLVLLPLLALPCLSLEAQEQPPAAAGSMMLELHGSSKILLGMRLGCSLPPDLGDPYDPDGGPVASSLDINDMMVIPPRKLFLDHDIVVFADGHATTELRVRGLCTGALQVFQNSCGESYGVTVRALPQALDSGGSLELFALGLTAGRFLIDLPMTLELTLTPLSGAGETVVRTREVQLRGFGSFDRNPVAGGEVLSSPTLIDADCDGVAESPLAANSDVFLGVRDAAPLPFCLEDFGTSICLAPAKIYGPDPDGLGQK